MFFVGCGAMEEGHSLLRYTIMGVKCFHRDVLVGYVLSLHSDLTHSDALFKDSIELHIRHSTPRVSGLR